MTATPGTGLGGTLAGASAAASLLAADHPGGAIEPAPLGVVAFVGRTLKGPVDEPVLVEDFTRFQQVFGGLWNGSLLPHSVEQFFEHGGSQALIVRVTNGARAPTIDLPAGRERLTLTGTGPGRQEALRVSVDHDGIDEQDTDLFNLVVQRVRRRGSELVEEQEIFRRVSVLPGSARELTRKLHSSRLVRVAGALPSVRPDITRGPDPRALIGYVECNSDGDDGQPLCDYDLIGSEARRTGLCALLGAPPFNFLYLPPPSRDADIGMSALLVAARLCRSRHALLLVDPPRSWQGVQAAFEALAQWPFHSADALMFFPRISAFDRLTGHTEEFPPSAAAIGTLLRDASGHVWHLDEPMLLRPGVVPRLWVDRHQRARLAQRGINALRSIRTPVRDAVPACTLAGEMGNGPDARLLSWRRLALHLAASIERGTRWVALEGNTPRIRERVCRQVEQFLAGYAAAGAFGSGERDRHWFVLCDERLNDAAARAAGVLRLIWGYHTPHGSGRLAWLVEHRPAASHTRAVSLNQLTALG